MTPFGKSVANELRSAMAPLETASILDYFHLGRAMRALLHNALFYVVATPAIEVARAHALDRAMTLARTIHTVGVRTQGISLAVDQARADAIVAMEDLVDAVADAQPTVTARALGVWLGTDQVAGRNRDRSSGNLSGSAEVADRNRSGGMR